MNSRIKIKKLKQRVKDLESQVRIMPYTEALEKMKDVHAEQYGYRQVTAGEFFGFRRTYEAMTGIKCPSYTKVG